MLTVLRQDRLDTLRSLGVEIIQETEWTGEPGTPSRKPVPLPDTVEQVRLGFSAGDWFEIMQREGEAYVGGCDGSDTAQDLLAQALHDGGTISGSDLLLLGEELLGVIPGFGTVDDVQFDEVAAGWRTGPTNPIDKLNLIYATLEPALKLSSSLELYAGASNQSPVQRAVSLLSDTLLRLNINLLFEVPEGHEEQTRAERLYFMARALGPTRELLSLLEVQTDTFEGWAVVMTGTPTVVTSIGGLCIYRTKEEADRIIEHNVRSSPEVAEIFKVVPVMVNVKDGLNVVK